MAGLDSSASHSSASHSPVPAHQRFHRINGPSKDSTYASLLELSYDLSAGINTCLEIFHAAELQRETNRAADDSELAAPAVSAFDAEKLLRMAMVSSALLTQETMRRIESENVPVTA